MDVEEGLQALLDRGYRFLDLRDDDGVYVIIGSYGWPDCYDRLHLWSEQEAIAARTVPSGRRGVDDVVWSYQDDAVATIVALLELPKPDEPGAPRLAKRAPTGLWLPPSTTGV